MSIPLEIMFVEDDDYLRETMAELLEGPDRRVSACASGEEALARCAEQPIDVLVTDVSLPGISGPELARQVLRRHPQVWIVLCSGYAWDRGFESIGPRVRSLPKPFEIDEMDALLEQARSEKCAAA